MHWKNTHSIGAIFTLLAVFLVPWISAEWLFESHGLGDRRIGTWIVCIGLVVALCAIVGDGITGRVSGILLNNENKFSLTVLQIVGWTLVLLPAIAVALSFNEQSTEAGKQSFTLEVPNEIWLLLGLSLATAAGTRIVLERKADTGEETVTPDQLRIANLRPATGFDPANGQRTFAPTGSGTDLEFRKATIFMTRSGEQVLQVGLLQVNPDPSQARIANFFDGSEIGNFQFADIGKVQMLLITGMAILGYAFLIGSLFADSSQQTVSGLPAFSETLLALIAVSHAGYLGYQAVPHTNVD